MVAVFADTNIVVYAYSSDAVKASIAERIIEAAPVISTQVVNEFPNIARIKMGLDIATRHRVATDLLHSCNVIAPDSAIATSAMVIEDRYRLSYWDALIAAAALAANCHTLYSEDFQNGQVFEGKLTVSNPFVNPVGIKS